jgi:hypothetical protein
MNAPCLPAKVHAIHEWSKRAVYRAKVVKSEAAEIVVMSAHSLTVGQRISFVPWANLERMRANRTPPAQTWRSAVIWRIAQNCLRLTRT